MSGKHRRAWLIGALIGAGLIVSGCERDPTLIGYWEILEWRVGESSAFDAGTMEFDDEGNVTCVLRYAFTGSSFAAVRQPEVQVLETDVSESEDFIASYQEEGETYPVSIGRTDGYGWGGAFEILDWTGGTARLHSDGAVPYGLEAEMTLLEMDLVIRR